MITLTKKKYGHSVGVEIFYAGWKEGYGRGGKQGEKGKRGRIKEDKGREEKAPLSTR